MDTSHYTVAEICRYKHAWIFKLTNPRMCRTCTFCVPFKKSFSPIMPAYWAHTHTHTHLRISILWPLMEVCWNSRLIKLSSCLPPCFSLSLTRTDISSLSNGNAKRPVPDNTCAGRHTQTHKLIRDIRFVFGL